MFHRKQKRCDGRKKAKWSWSLPHSYMPGMLVVGGVILGRSTDFLFASVYSSCRQLCIRMLKTSFIPLFSKSAKTLIWFPWTFFVFNAGICVVKFVPRMFEAYCTHNLQKTSTAYHVLSALGSSFSLHFQDKRFLANISIEVLARECPDLDKMIKTGQSHIWYDTHFSFKYCSYL